MANPADAWGHFDNIYSVIYTSYDLAVDTFFLMGALLMTYATLSAISKKTLNIRRMIFHRYLRYTPPLAALILFTVTFLKFFLDGPRSDANSYVMSDCQHYWLSALFHLQNYVNPNEVCLSHTWYLTVDFQLYIVSPFLIYPASKWGWKYLWVVPGLAIASSIYVFHVSMVNEIYPYDMNYNEMIYYPTHARLSTWMTGIVVGYILFTYKSKKIQISKTANAFLWILALSILVTSMIVHQPFYVPNHRESLLANAFFMGFNRLAWSIGISWVILACHNLRTGGIIKWFLELPQWQPIGKSFCW